MSTYSYTYFDYLENAYESYYDYYYESIYWPQHYGPNYNGTYPPSPYEFIHPKVEYVNPPLYAFIIIMAIVSIVIAVFVYYKIFSEQCINKTEPSEANRVGLALTLFSLTAHLAQNVTSTLLYYYMYIAYDPILSPEVLLTWDIFFCLTRVSIYALFIYRFYLVFQAHQMLYTTSRCYKGSLFAGSVFIMMVQCTFYVLYVLVFYGYADFGHPDIMVLWKKIYWAFLALDFCFIGALGFLLSRSILIVIRDLNSLNTTNENAPSSATGTSRTTNTTTSTTAPTTKVEGQLAQYVEKTVDQEPELSGSASNVDKEVIVIVDIQTPKENQLGGELVQLATKIALLIVVSMVSSFCYQFIWMLSYEFGNLHLLLFSYTWCFDGVSNMVCIYLSLPLAKNHYKRLCFEICKCHQCALRCITKAAHVDDVDI